VLPDDVPGRPEVEPLSVLVTVQAGNERRPRATKERRKDIEIDAFCMRA
jgi:hypothetical protein